MTSKQIGLLVGLAAVGVAWYYGRQTSRALAALRPASPSPIVNPPVVGPGTDENGLTPDQPGYDWSNAGIG